MRLRIVALTLLLLLPLSPAQVERQGLYISEYDGNNPSGREFVELSNGGPDAIDLQGYSVEDRVGNRYTFPTYRLPAHAHIVVWSAAVAGEFGFTQDSVWNNQDEDVILTDPTRSVIHKITSISDGGEQSAHLQADGSWGWGLPTPGYEAGQYQGVATLQVEDLPPSITLQNAPTQASSGATYSWTVTFDDPNQEIMGWRILDRDIEIANGTDVGTTNLLRQAPSTTGLWNFTYEVWDAQHHVSLNDSIPVHELGLTIQFLDGDHLDFGTIAPGTAQVDAMNRIRIRNDLSQTKTPYVDISDLVAGNHSLVAAGHVELIVNGQPLPYTKPLEALPALAPGEEHLLSFRLVNLPPLAPGVFEASYSIVTGS